MIPNLPIVPAKPFVPSYYDYHMNQDRVSYDSRHGSSSVPKNDSFSLEILGLKLDFDDLIIIGLLFFLYSEGNNDQMLYIVLVLLLLS